MAAYFLDSSAIVKRYVAEAGHAWVVDLCDAKHGHDLYLAQTALVEVVATLCRKARESVLTTAVRDGAISDFRRDAIAVFAVRVVDAPVYTRAGDLCRTYRLRAYDSVQLAVALSLRDDALAGGFAPPVFVCADTDLLAFAASEGLPIENPNSHP